MQAKKTQNKFIGKLKTEKADEEKGPKCIVCHEGYTKKPHEILGIYVFSKRLKIAELSPTGTGFLTTVGYQTVTHSNFIHFLCH
jgi:E3 ubiquitin-protein ligase UBR4